MVQHEHNQLSQWRTKKIKTRLYSTKWGWEIRSNFSRTHPQDTTGINGHRKFTKKVRSSVKTKLDPFGKVINLSDNPFSKCEFYLLKKNLNFCPHPDEYCKQNVNKDLLKFYCNVKLRVHNFRIVQMNLHLNTIAIGYQINYPAALKSS